ncbi:MAG: glycosyltransferase family 39 protein [Myxococcota bacterium]
MFTAGVAHALPAALWQGPVGEAGAFEVAGQITSVLFGAASIPLVYLLVRRLAPPADRVAVARAGAAMAALSPFLARLGAQVLTEATYTFFFLIAALAGLALLRARRAARAAAFGLAVGVACLNRPEAMGLLIVIGAWIGLPALRRPAALAKSAGLGLIVAGFFLIGIFPQMAVTHARTGVWTLSAKGGAIFKKSVLGEAIEKEKWLYPAPKKTGSTAGKAEKKDKEKEDLTAADTSIPAFIARHPLAFARHYSAEFFGFAACVPEAMGIGLFAFALAGVLARRRIPWGRDERVAASIPLAYIGMLSLFHASERFLFPLVPFGIFWSAIGLREVAARLEEARPAAWVRRLPAAARAPDGVGLTGGDGSPMRRSRGHDASRESLCVVLEPRKTGGGVDAAEPSARHEGHDARLDDRGLLRRRAGGLFPLRALRRGHGVPPARGSPLRAPRRSENRAPAAGLRCAVHRRRRRAGPHV